MGKAAKLKAARKKALNGTEPTIQYFVNHSGKPPTPDQLKGLAIEEYRLYGR